MKKAFISASAAIMVIAGILLAGSSRLGGQNAPAAPAADAPKTAEQAFKNIQVLKGTPADQLQPAMQFISNSLGVECEFCHVRDQFEKDDKKAKATARTMIQMQMAINREHFKGETEVTCNSCHHGAERPAAIPIIADEEPKRPEGPRPDAAQQPPALPSADQIIDKYVQAIGGAEALQKVSSRVEKGTISFGGRQFPVDVMAKAPNKRISTVHTPNGDNVTAFDGHAGWLGNPGGRPPRDMNAQEIDAVSFDSTFYLPVELKKMFRQLRVRPAEKIGGKEMYQLIGGREGKPPMRLFFDKESGLLVRTIRYAETPLGRNPTQVDYADYRNEGGVKTPFQWTVARPLGRFTIQVSEVQQNVPIDDLKFEKPLVAPAPAAEKAPAK
jgi:photosynthetic reaction center cytochrome c subunit